MAYKYSWCADASDAEVTAKVKEALLANVLRGGENVATGALLGALLGAAAGYSRLPSDLKSGLAPSGRKKLDSDIARFVELIPFVKASL